MNTTKKFTRPPLESKTPSWHTELIRVRNCGGASVKIDGVDSVDSVGVRVAVVRELLRCGMLTAKC